MYADLHDFRNADTEWHPYTTDVVDPLDPDVFDDMPVIVTRRRLIRLALVAAETGARFQRESLDHDPVAWMLTPRALFDGRDGIEGALSLDGCMRAILLHGLGIGLDADPTLIDDLLTSEEVEVPCPSMV